MNGLKCMPIMYGQEVKGYRQQVIAILKVISLLMAPNQELLIPKLMEKNYFIAMKQLHHYSEI